jgi:hypothetical protein
MADFLLSWLLVPLVLCVLSLGCGLLVAEIATRTGAPRAEPFPGLLIAPIGFAAVVVLTSLLTTWELTAPLAGVGPLAVALAGFAVGRHRVAGWWRRRREAIWPLFAAAAPAAALALPVVLTGKAGFTGFARITDLAHQLTFMEWLREHGRLKLPIGDTTSSYAESAQKLVLSDYPGGTQSVMAAMGDLGHVDVMWAYQPVLAFVAAMLGLTLYAVLRRAIPSRPLRGVAAAVAAQPTILYAYALSAGVKELSGAAAIVLVAAVFAERRPLGWSPLVPGAVALASAYSIFNLTVLPWLGMVFVVLLGWELLTEHGRARTLARWAGVVALTALIAAPAVTGGLSLLRAAGGAEGPQGLGNLAAPIPAWSSVGPWITADHRFPLAQYGKPSLTYALIAIALVLAAVGFIAAARDRDRGLVALGISGAVALLYMLTSSGVWLQLKAFCMTAPITLALAFAGAVWLGRRVRPLKLVGLGAAGLVALGVLYGNALHYHSISLGDYDRLDDLKQVNAQFAGKGPALFPNFDEFGEYVLRDAEASGLVNPLHGVMIPNRTALPGMQTVRDTDELDQRFVQRFRLIIRRRDPTMSRPPSNFRLAAVSDDYEVWQRTGDPATIEAHYPLENRDRTRSARFCRQVAGSVEKAGPGARIAYAVPKANLVRIAPGAGTHPPAWARVGDDVRAGSPGRWEQQFEVPRTGTYTAFIRGSFGRAVSVRIDGRLVDELQWRESYPGQFNALGPVRLTQGRHVLEVLRGGGSLLPGTGNDPAGTTTTIGPFALDPAFERETVVTAPASRLGSLCASNTRMDWLEVLRRAPR